MEGQIIDKGVHKRTGQQIWLVRVFAGRDAKGKKRYISKQVHGGKREAQRVLREMLAERDKGILPESTRESVNHYLDRWLQAHETAVKQRTYQNDVEMLARYIRPYVGDIKLNKLTPLDIQEMYAKLQAKGLKPATIRRAHSVFNSALKQAVMWRLLPQIPASFVKLPKLQQEEMHCLSEEDAKRFLDACVYDRYGTLFHFLLFTGCRPGEAFALKWTDIDFEQKKVYIQRTLSRRGKGYMLTSPKTRRSVRNVVLSDTLLNELRQLKEQQEQEKEAAGELHMDNGFVFTSENGQPIQERNLVQRHFKPLLNSIGVSEKVRLYDLRHTCATLLLKAGVNPKVVSERLGHSDITLTLNTYSRVLPDTQSNATAKLESMLFGS